jgi:hypothetical protein
LGLLEVSAEEGIEASEDAEEEQGGFTFAGGGVDGALGQAGDGGGADVDDAGEGGLGEVEVFCGAEKGFGQHGGGLGGVIGEGEAGHGGVPFKRKDTHFSLQKQ